VAWAKVSQAEEPKQLSKDRPNCLLAEADETWTLEDGITLPVRRIEMRLDFEPAVTWMVDPKRVELDHEGSDSIPVLDGVSPWNMRTPRFVFNRLTEEQLRDIHARKLLDVSDYYGRARKPGTLRSWDPEGAAKEVSYRKDREVMEARVSEVMASLDMADVIRGRMTETWMASKAADPKGVFAIIESPAVKHYILGVTPFRITSANLIIQAPARVVFGG